MRNREKFTITKDHLKLAQRLIVEYDDSCEFGAPIIDPKRPYGNSAVYNDISDILSIEPEEKLSKFELEFSDEQREYMDKMHKEMEIVLQICLYLQKFEEGEYVSDGYGYDWRKV